MIKNSIRSILDRQGLSMPAGKSGWTNKAKAALAIHARPLAEVSDDDLWRGQLHIELQALEQIEGLVTQVEAKLEAIARADERVQRLQTIPGVGLGWRRWSWR